MGYAYPRGVREDILGGKRKHVTTAVESTGLQKQVVSIFRVPAFRNNMLLPSVGYRLFKVIYYIHLQAISVSEQHTITICRLPSFRSNILHPSSGYHRFGGTCYYHL
jgi:hypothetical protein